MAKATASKTITTEVEITLATARSIVAPYAEKDSVLARRVVTLKPFIGAGHSADTILRSVARAGVVIPGGMGRSTVATALTVARTMAKTETLTDATKSATAGIAAALLRIARTASAHGGGTTGMQAALDAATTGTDNPAEIAERLMAMAETVEATATKARRELAQATRKARPAIEVKATEDDGETETETKAASKAASKAAAPSLASVSVRVLLAEVNARVLAGYVLTDEEDALLLEVASNVEQATNARETETVTA